MRNDSPTPRRVRVAKGIYTENGSWIALYRCGRPTDARRFCARELRDRGQEGEARTAH